MYFGNIMFSYQYLGLCFQGNNSLVLFICRCFSLFCCLLQLTSAMGGMGIFNKGQAGAARLLQAVCVLCAMVSSTVTHTICTLSAGGGGGV